MDQMFSAFLYMQKKPPMPFQESVVILSNLIVFILLQYEDHQAHQHLLAEPKVWHLKPRLPAPQ